MSRRQRSNLSQQCRLPSLSKHPETRLHHRHCSHRGSVQLLYGFICKHAYCSGSREYVHSANLSFHSIANVELVGLNAYFAYNVVGFHGSGHVPYKVALAAVFVEGFVFVGLSILGLRQWLARAIPRSIKLASSVGIGLYLSMFFFTGKYLRRGTNFT
jgi:hypothetical protein